MWLFNFFLTSLLHYELIISDGGGEEHQSLNFEVKLPGYDINLWNPLAGSLWSSFHSLHPRFPHLKYYTHSVRMIKGMHVCEVVGDLLGSPCALLKRVSKTSTGIKKGKILSLSRRCFLSLFLFWERPVPMNQNILCHTCWDAVSILPLPFTRAAPSVGMLLLASHVQRSWPWRLGSDGLTPFITLKMRVWISSSSKIVKLIIPIIAFKFFLSCVVAPWVWHFIP